MKNLISAIQFITILPVGKNDYFNPRGMIPYFSLVGLILGLIVAGFDILFSMLWNGPTVAVLDVVLLLILTGAFHIDGLGDAADGLFSHRPKEKALLIMKDSRIGMMGLVAVLCGLAIKCCGIADMDSHRFLLLLIIPAYSRAGTLFGIRFLEYGRSEGTGQALFNEKLSIFSFWGLLLPIIISMLMGFEAILFNLIFFITIFSILFYYKRKMGCITGDMLGAMTEITESVLFLSAAATGVFV